MQKSITVPATCPADPHPDMQPEPDQAVNACIAWLDLCSSHVEQCAEWQRRLWQPLLDLQARWFEECLRHLGGLTLQRGSEQLA